MPPIGVARHLPSVSKLWVGAASCSLCVRSECRLGAGVPPPTTITSNGEGIPCEARFYASVQWNQACTVRFGSTWNHGLAASQQRPPACENRAPCLPLALCRAYPAARNAPIGRFDHRRLPIASRLRSAFRPGRDRSFARGGAATACYVVGLAAMAPALGRLIDSRSSPHPACIRADFPGRLRRLVGVNHRRVPGRHSLLPRRPGQLSTDYRVHANLFRQRLTDELYCPPRIPGVVLIESIFIVAPCSSPCSSHLRQPRGGTVPALCGVRHTLFRVPGVTKLACRGTGPGKPLGPLGERGFIRCLRILCYSWRWLDRDRPALMRASEIAPRSRAFCLGLMSAGSALGGLAMVAAAALSPHASVRAMLALMGRVSRSWRCGATWAFATAAFRWRRMCTGLIIQSMLVAKTARAEHVTEAFTGRKRVALRSRMGVASGGPARIFPLARGLGNRRRRGSVGRGRARFLTRT